MRRTACRRCPASRRTTSTTSRSGFCASRAVGAASDANSRCLPSSLPYDEVKYQALLACQALEQRGVITRADGYQAILDSIAYDIRTKNRRQIQRTKEIGSMQQALGRLREKKTDLEEQIAMYNAHNAQSISNMQTKRCVRSRLRTGRRADALSFLPPANGARSSRSASNSGTGAAFNSTARCQSTALGSTRPNRS